jgi:formylglycine-generating enzyme required for sulfatase activity
MPPHLEIGFEPIAGYRLIEPLGRGGFGEVWKARAPGGIHVALKFICIHTGHAEPELRALDAIREIRHPHLLDLQFAVRVAGWLVIGTSLCDCSLWDRLLQCQEQGLPGIPAEELLGYLAESAKAIDFLNEPHNGVNGKAACVQHRDIKPHNIFLVGGSVKLADFGLAKILQRSLETDTGCMTPAYASPEMFQGQISSQSDQYSLGVTYCQLRSGQLPFVGNLPQLMYGHLHKEPNLSGLPARERGPVARALAKKPADRWPNCRAFAEALASRHQARHVIAVREAAPRPTPKGPCLLPELVNDLGMTLVLIPAGRFRMGSSSNEPGRQDDEEPHNVEITQPFYLSIHPVTQGEFAALMGGARPSWFAPTGGGRDKVSSLDTDRFPVECVSWEEAVEFCRRLTDRSSPASVVQCYRLPTEAEWEFACRGRDHTEAPFQHGWTLSSEQANFNGDYPYGTVPAGAYLGRPTQVGSYEPNDLELYDMHGNVWEWCADWYDAASSGFAAEQDPQGPSTSAANLRVIRGGSWYGRGSDCRAASRRGYDAAGRTGSIGFRVVLVPLVPAAAPATREARESLA